MSCFSEDMGKRQTDSLQKRGVTDTPTLGAEKTRATPILVTRIGRTASPTAIFIAPLWVVGGVAHVQSLHPSDRLAGTNAPLGHRNGDEHTVRRKPARWPQQTLQTTRVPLCQANT